MRALPSMKLPSAVASVVMTRVADAAVFNELSGRQPCFVMGVQRVRQCDVCFSREQRVESRTTPMRRVGLILVRALRLAAPTSLVLLFWA